MKNLIARFVREEEGQDLVEYALLIAFIALAASSACSTWARPSTTTYQQHLEQPAGAVS